MIKKLEGGALLMAVADGMGGEARGDLAADIMKESLDRLHHREGDRDQLLMRAIREANNIILVEVE